VVRAKAATAPREELRVLCPPSTDAVQEGEAVASYVLVAECGYLGRAVVRAGEIGKAEISAAIVARGWSCPRAVVAFAGIPGCSLSTAESLHRGALATVPRAAFGRTGTLAVERITARGRRGRVGAGGNGSAGWRPAADVEDHPLAPDPHSLRVVALMSDGN
jgi:hypothetical protein